MTSDEALEEYRTAEREAMEAGDPRLAARVLRRIYYQLGLRGDTAGAHDALEQAIALVEHDAGAQEVLAELYACRSEAEMFAGRSEDSLRWAERALELPAPRRSPLMALHLRGNARCETGDLGGVDDLRRALEIAEGSGVAIDIVTSYSYLLEWVGLEDGPSTGLPMNRATVDLCRRRGIEGQGMWSRAEGLWLRFDAGLWDELLDEVAGPRRVGRGARRRADRHGGPALPGAGARPPRRRRRRRSRSPTRSCRSLARSRTCRCWRRRSWSRWWRTPPPATRRPRSSLAEEFHVATAEGPTEYRELYLPEVVRALIGAGEAGLAARIVGDRPVHVRRTRLAVASSHAMLAEARGEFGGRGRAVPRGGRRLGSLGRTVRAGARARGTRALARGARTRTTRALTRPRKARSIFDSLAVATAERHAR